MTSSTPLPAEGTAPRLLLSIEDGARALGLSRRSFLRMLSAGRIPSVRVGGRRLIRITDLEHYVQGLPQA